MLATHTDPTQGLSIVSSVGSQRGLTRYLFRAINSIDPDRILQCDWMQSFGGGDEINTNCLRRTLHGYVPRAWATPLEIWVKSYPVELLAEGAEDMAVRLDSTMSPDSLELNNSRPAFLGTYKPPVMVRFYPGDELPGIIDAAGSRGLVELDTLMGQEWYDDKGNPGVVQQVNQDFFPQRPIKLKAIRELIEKGAGLSPLHAAVAPKMRQSCDVSERWAQGVLARANLEMRRSQQARPGVDWVYEYSGVERSLLEQLDMQPQDVNNTEVMSRMYDAVAAKGGETLTPEMIAQIAGAVAREFAMQGIPQAVQPEARHDCECGWVNEKNTPQGLAMHKTRYCELKQG